MWRLAAARPAFETALARDAELLAATLGLAHCHRAAGELTRASALLERLSERLPDSRDVRHELAHTYECSGLWDRAIALLEAGLEGNADDVAGWNLLASCHAQAGHLEETIAAAGVVLKLDPVNTVATILTARGEVTLGRPDQAVARLANISEAVWNDVELALAAAQIHEQLRRQEEAEALLRRTLELEPGNRLAISRLLDIKLSLCDWRDYDGYIGGLVRDIADDVEAGRPIAIDVFNLQALPLDYAAIAAAAAQAAEPARGPAPPAPIRAAGSPIRLGYLLP